MRSIALVPAYNAEHSVGAVVRDVIERWPSGGEQSVVVVDDGSSDATASAARDAGALVVSHERNRGKGAALKTGLRAIQELGGDVAVSLDADGQHPAEEAVRLATDGAPVDALVLGTRDLVAAGAARANRFGNGVSNFFLSAFARRRLGDTQCGLRRYPVAPTLELGARDDGYAFEAEIVLRALHASWTVVEVPVRVIYPPPQGTPSHFRIVRDPARIVARVVRTLIERRRRR